MHHNNKNKGGTKITNQFNGTTLPQIDNEKDTKNTNTTNILFTINTVANMSIDGEWNLNTIIHNENDEVVTEMMWDQKRYNNPYC